MKPPDMRTLVRDAESQATENAISQQMAQSGRPDLRTLVRDSIRRAAERQRAAVEQRRRELAARASSDELRRRQQTQDAERAELDRRIKAGEISHGDADLHRARFLSMPAAEYSDPSERAEAFRRTKQFEDQMLKQNSPSYIPEGSEEEYRMKTLPSERGPMIGPDINYSTDESGQIRAHSAEEIDMLRQLYENAWDKEVEAEISAPIPKRRPQSQPQPIIGKDELGSPTRGKPLDDAKVRASRVSDVDAAALEAQIQQRLISDERAKTDIRPSTMPAGIRSPSLGGEPGANDIGMLYGSAGPELSPNALKVDPGGGRIDSRDPRAFLESTIPGRSGLAAAPTRGGTIDNLSLSDRRAEVAEARGASKPARSGLAAADASDMRKRALDFMQFQASMPKFAMVDVGGRFRA